MRWTQADKRGWQDLLRPIRDAIASAGHATVEAIAENAKAYQEANKPKPSGPPERVRNEVDFPPEVVNRYYSEQDKANRLQRRTFWVGLLTLLALIAYTCVTYRQWRTMNATYDQIKQQTAATITAANAATTAAQAATEQTKLLRQQLVLRSNSPARPAGGKTPTRTYGSTLRNQSSPQPLRSSLETSSLDSLTRAVRATDTMLTISAARKAAEKS